MTPRHRPAPLRARSLGDLLDLVPSLLGFHPTDSLVAILAHEGRIAVTARLDLPDEADLPYVAEGLEPLRQRFPGATWVLAAYTSDAVAAWTAVGLVSELLPAGTEVRGVHVCEGRWFAEPGDTGQTYDPGCGVLAAEAAYRGVRVLPDRSELGRALDPPDDVAAAEAALDRALAVPPVALVARARALVRASAGAAGAPAPTDAATLAVAAFSPEFAHEIITALDGANAAEVQRFWAGVVRGVPACAAAGPLVIVGMAAWVGGEGALANICLQRAAPSAADQPWYRFLDLACRLALPPGEWPGIRAELAGSTGAA